MTVLITARELAEALDSPTPPVVLDVRWQLTAAGGAAYDGRSDHLAGHIPRAVFVDLDTELAAHGEPTDGRHPLPSIDSLQASARRWGIDDGDAVVVYDATGNLAAARAWWLLRWAGIADVRLLDGGLDAWTSAGLGLVTVAEQPPRPAGGNVTLSPGHLPTLELADIASYSGQLVDARAAARYRGETEPIDPKAGHIPGALNAPTTDNLAPDGTFLPAEELRARFESAGIDGTAPVAAYCGSGVTAAHEIAALAIAGIDAALYPGSWSQWSNHDLPVATE
ncbi:MAG TPA: sulfurtransferase [Nocardioides sp.]|nr:sulfurtransferase [Nocardioides sp.]